MHVEEIHAATSLMSMKSCRIPFQHSTLGVQLPPLRLASLSHRRPPSPLEESWERSTIKLGDLGAPYCTSSLRPLVRVSPLTPPVNSNDSLSERRFIASPKRVCSFTRFPTLGSPTLLFSPTPAVKILPSGEVPLAHTAGHPSSPDAATALHPSQPCIVGVKADEHSLPENEVKHNDELGLACSPSKNNYSSRNVPPNGHRKVRSTIQTLTSSPKPKLPIKKKHSTIKIMSEWSKQLEQFLSVGHVNLLVAQPSTVYVTLPSGCTTVRPAPHFAVERNKSRNRASNLGKMNTHRFVLPINVATFTPHDWVAMTEANTAQPSDSFLSVYGCHYISCVRWDDELWVTNSDICHIVKFRMEVLGFEVVDREKLFEGVYSDLRIVPRKEYRYEEAKSSFLNALDEYGCISMHKRQKLYKWHSIPHAQLFASAVRRSVQTGRSCRAVRQPALKLCGGGEGVESVMIN